MEEFLKRIKLIHSFTTELDVPKEQFVDGFFRNVDQDELHLFFQFTDLFSRSDNLIKGYMNFDKFKLKANRRFFDFKTGIVLASGHVSEKNGKTTIETSITAKHPILIVPILFMLVIYTSMFGVILFSEDTSALWAVFPFLIFHGALMVGIPYFMLRREVKSFSLLLEREYYYMTKIPTASDRRAN